MKNEGEHGGASSLTAALARVLAEGAIAVLATVVEAPGDANRVGAKLLVEENGARTGGTGDAALDQLIARHAPVFLASRAEARTHTVEELSAENKSASESDPATGSQLVTGSELTVWEGVRVLFERVEPEPHVVVCGAGHVGAALARLAHAVGYRVTLVDDRADFVTRARFPEEGIVLVAAESWSESLLEVLGTGRGVSVAVVTRGHNEDEGCMRAVLQVRADYIGMIGSRRRTNIVLERLRETGVDESHLREVRAPVGLDIGAVTPEEVALSILAEIVAARRGGTCAPLSGFRREREKGKRQK